MGVTKGVMPPLGPGVPSALSAGVSIPAQNSRHELYNLPPASPHPYSR